MCFSGGTVSITGDNSRVAGLMHTENGASLTIYNGTYYYDVSQYVAEGREMKEVNHDGIYIVRMPAVSPGINDDLYDING